MRTSYSLNRISELHETDFSGEAPAGEQRLQPIEEGEGGKLREDRDRRDERERRARLSPGREADADTPGGEG